MFPPSSDPRTLRTQSFFWNWTGGFFFLLSGWFCPNTWSRLKRRTRGFHLAFIQSRCVFFKISIVVGETGSVPVLVVLNIYVHPWLPWLLLIACCRGDSVSVASRVLRSLVTSLLLKFGRLLLGFQGVYEGLDAPFHAAGHPAGHGVWRWRRGRASALRGRPCNQTLLIPQLKKENSRSAVFDFLGFKMRLKIEQSCLQACVCALLMYFVIDFEQTELKAGPSIKYTVEHVTTCLLRLASSHPVPPSSIRTHHTCCLHSLGHTASVWIAPEHVALEVLVPGVHDKGEWVRVPSHPHEGQETDATLYDRLLFFFLRRQTRIRSLKPSLISNRWALLIYEWKTSPCLFFDDSQSGVCNAQYDGGPVLLSCGGQQAFYSSIYDVHTWRQTRRRSSERGLWIHRWFQCP